VLDAKLAEQGISADIAASAHDRVSGLLGDESARFANITALAISRRPL
jgi:hypothetical protein